MRSHLLSCLAAVAVSGVAHAQAVKNDIYTLAGDVRNEVFASSAPSSSLERARADLTSALSLIRGGGGGGGNGEIFCKRVRDTEFYAPARLADGAWLQDNGTSIDQCRAQIVSAAFGLFCARVRETDFYAPRLVADLAWRGENGTDFATCDRQLRGARPGVFCQRVRETAYYAPARIATGEWLQDNGVSLELCLSSLGLVESLALSPAASISEPSLPVNDSPAVE